MASTRPGRDGFSLIELLVVISIIAVLAALLLPGVRLVRAQAQQARCASSQRQLVVANLAYAGDWEGLLPRIKAPRADPTLNIMWFSAIATYVGYESDDTSTIYVKRGGSVIWGCPAWQPATFSTSRPGLGMTWYPYAPASSEASMFWLDPAGGWDPAGRDIAVAKVGEQAKRIMIGDAADWHLWFSRANPAYASNWDPARHNGRANYAFFDGHVQGLAAGAQAWRGCSDPGAATWDP